jgi:hypothetical protein
MQDSVVDNLNISQEEARQYMQQHEKESYELMRICRLNRIKIKNPAKWDKAKFDDFVGNQFSRGPGFFRSKKESISSNFKSKRNMTNPSVKGRSNTLEMAAA